MLSAECIYIYISSRACLVKMGVIKLARATSSSNCDHASHQSSALASDPGGPSPEALPWTLDSPLGLPLRTGAALRSPGPSGTRARIGPCRLVQIYAPRVGPGASTPCTKETHGHRNTYILTLHDYARNRNTYDLYMYIYIYIYIYIY